MSGRVCSGNNMASWGHLNLSSNSDSNTYLYFSFLLWKLGIMLNLWSCCEETASHSAWLVETTVIIVTVVSSTLLRKKLTNLPRLQNTFEVAWPRSLGLQAPRPLFSHGIEAMKQEVVQHKCAKLMSCNFSIKL